MENFSKVSIAANVRRNHIIKISLVGSVCLLGLVLCVYSLVIKSFLFALWYALAFVLGLSFVIIKINACFPTFIMADSEKVTLSAWKNGIMPYTLPENPNFLSDFIPDKIKISEIAMEDITSVIIGSRKFLKKSLSEEEYPEILKRLDDNKHFDGVLKRMDFIFIRAKSGENCFMSVTDFDLLGIKDFLEVVEKNCQGVQVVTNIPKLVRMRNTRVN